MGLLARLVTTYRGAVGGHDQIRRRWACWVDLYR